MCEAKVVAELAIMVLSAPRGDDPDCRQAVQPGRQ